MRDEYRQQRRDHGQSSHQAYTQYGSHSFNEENGRWKEAGAGLEDDRARHGGRRLGSSSWQKYFSVEKEGSGR